MDGSQPETGSQYNAWSLASSWRCQNSLRQSGSARLHKTISRLQLAFCMGLFSNYLEPFFCKSELKYQIFFKKKTEAARAVNIYRISSIARIKHSAHFAKTTCNNAASTMRSAADLPCLPPVPLFIGHSSLVVFRKSNLLNIQQLN